MKEHSSFIRWGIPGWTSAISLAMFIIVDSFAAADPKLFLALNSAVSSKGLWQAILAGVLVAGAGIPIGFVLYQIYFFLRWSSPFSAYGVLPPFASGRMNEMESFRKALDENALSGGKQWRERMLSPSYDFRIFWDYVDPFLAEVYFKIDPRGGAIARQTYLLDIVHSLGASILGIYLGYVTYLLTKWYFDLVFPHGMVIAILIPLLTLVLLSWEARFSRMRLPFPAEMSVYFLSLAYAFFNPSLTNFMMVWWLIVLISFAIVAYRRRMVWIAVHLVFIIAILSLQSASITIAFVGSLDWAILLSALILSFLSIVFVKNRVNTKRKLTALQQYAIHMFRETSP